MCFLRVSLLNAITFLTVIHHPGGLGCNPADLPPTVEQKVEFAMVVVKGTVLDHFPGSRIIDGQYVANFKVECVFKDTGKRVPKILNITNGGPNPGKCFAAQLDKGESYVVFLRDLDTRYEANAPEIHIKDPATVSRITSTCGLKVSDIYPGGITEKDTSAKCPKIATRPCPSTTPYVATKPSKNHPKVSTIKPKSTSETTGLTTTTPTAYTTTTPIAYTTAMTTRMVTFETKTDNGNGSQKTMIYSQTLIFAVICAWLII